MADLRNAHKILVGKPERKRPLGRPRHKWDDNIIMGLREIGSKDVDWTQLAWNREWWWVLVNTVINLRAA
jgi:hypothetical protein